jgi:hypothetical protein
MKALLILGIILIAGCIGGVDEKSLAKELADLRQAYVPEGLLIPTTFTQQENYRNELLAFLPRFNNKGFSAVYTTNEYISGSLRLIDMQRKTEEGFSLLAGADPSLLDCSSHSAVGKALVLLKEAKNAGEQANTFFKSVQKDSSIANILGADYVLGAVETASESVKAHEKVIEQIELSCVTI